MILDDRKGNAMAVTKAVTNQNVIMENREKLNISGVYDIINFDDELVTVDTELGLLTVKGFDLRMNKLNLENAELIVEGEISSLSYSEKTGNTKTSLFNKIFK